jgi:hypothetical protein
MLLRPACSPAAVAQGPGSARHGPRSPANGSTSAPIKPKTLNGSARDEEERPEPLTVRIEAGPLQEHLADAQGRALLMGDDTSTSSTSAIIAGMTADCREVYRVRLRG